MSKDLDEFMAPDGVGDLYANTLHHLVGFTSKQVAQALMAMVVADLAFQFKDCDVAADGEVLLAAAVGALSKYKLVPEDKVTESATLLVISIGALIEIRKAALRARTSDSQANSEAASVPAEEA